MVSVPAAPSATARGIPVGRWPWRGLILPLGAALALELVGRVSGFRSDSVPLPSEIAGAFARALSDGNIARATLDTLSAALGGLAVGATIGLVLGVTFGILPVVFWLLEFTTEILRPIPSVALIPVALLIFGFGQTMEIALIAKSTIWPILFVTHAAVAGIDPRLIEVAKLLKLRFQDIVRKIVIPAVLPAIFVGFRLSIGLALLMAITTEIVVNPRGLGYAMMRAQETMRSDLLFALLLWTGLLGWAVNSALEAGQRRLFRQNEPGEALP
jgi:NitT/TauT family transport system permease protein